MTVGVLGDAAGLLGGGEGDVGIWDREGGGAVDGDEGVYECYICRSSWEFGFEDCGDIEDVATWDGLAVEVRGEADAFGTGRWCGGR